jgi:adenylate cyclase class IV
MGGMPAVKSKSKSKRKSKSKSKSKSKAPAFEYEYRFRDFDAPALLRAARRLGAEAPERSLLINTAFAAPDPHLHVRLRDIVPARGGGGGGGGGGRGQARERVTVLTVKRLGGAFETEHETGVTDPEQAHALLAALGCTRQHTMMKFRTVVRVPGLGELDFDEHPGLPALLEVESPSLAKLDRLVRALGLRPPPRTGPNGAPATFSPQHMYHDHYGVTLDRPMGGDLTFERPSNIRDHVTANRALFERTLLRQRREAARLITL